MAKKLEVNCGSCDARYVTEETLSAYESVAINCGSILVTPESQALLNRYGVAVNCGSSCCIPKDAVLRSANGRYTITPADDADGTGRVYLQVNGLLEIAPGSRKALERYVGITVNGSLLCPESLGSCLQNVSINGATTLYPDEAVVLKRSAVIDRLFALRAKEKLYWSARRMILVDPKLDGEKLAARGARFRSQEVILAESLVESLIDCIDERSEIVIVPDGTTVVCDDVALTPAMAKKVGTRLYVIGDLEIAPESREVLAGMDYLKVCGDATVPEDLQALLLEKAEIDGVVQVRNPFLGRRISDKSTLRITRWMLEQDEHGIWVEDCAVVTLDEDIPGQLILEKLHLVDCGVIRCSDAQEAAVSMVSEDCGCIERGDKADAKAPDAEVVSVNAAEYTL